ncbi:MAG: rhodanese-like domain-containing protein [Clostridium sp.]
MLGLFEKNNFESIDVNDLEKDSRGITLIDVREPSEYKGGHIPIAKNIPMKEILVNCESHLDKSKEYHIVCQSGGRSSKVCKFLASKGFTVVNVSGGTGGYIGKINK